MILNIDKEAIPYYFDVNLGGETYTMAIHYNSRYDFFTAGLQKDDDVIITEDKIVYGRPLFSVIEDDERLPNVTIIPLDEGGGQEERVTYENLGETVFLWVGELDE